MPARSGTSNFIHYEERPWSNHGEGASVIQAVKIDALTHPNEWTGKVNARIILLTIYGASKSLSSGTGIDMANLLGLPP